MGIQFVLWGYRHFVSKLHILKTIAIELSFLLLYLGFFGEVFRGIWNGTDVAIKVFLEQDLTAENMEDFCNEISILRLILVKNANCFGFVLSMYLSDSIFCVG